MSNLQTTLKEMAEWHTLVNTDDPTIVVCREDLCRLLSDMALLKNNAIAGRRAARALDKYGDHLTSCICGSVRTHEKAIVWENCPCAFWGEVTLARRAGILEGKP